MLVEERLVEELAKRVAQAWKRQVVQKSNRTASISLGETWTKGSVRIHRYSNSFKIWDLTNAGKRGKRIRVMTVMPSMLSSQDNEKEWMRRMGLSILDYAQSYDRVKAFFSDILQDYPGEISIDEHVERGIDVVPASTETIRLRWSVGTTQLEITATPLDFSVKSSALFEAGEGHLKDKPQNPGFRQDTSYWPAKKQDALIFYTWLRDNRSSVDSMDINELRELWHKLGVRYDYH